MVDPFDTASIRKGLLMIIQDKEYREGLVQKGFENIKRFSWEKCARETLKVLEDC